ncbi:hypothetical protein C2S52_023245 [Perilla frutescens var. hirtella]|nr:hypothetical protein C2S52_023245 [Perilla frutescens var. hirtella]
MEENYNRDIGIFQLNAELISAQGNVIAKSSHPSMLRFSSWPIRYTRTLLMGVPLLLGIISETQRLTFPALKHTEAAAAAATFPRDIRITLIPRSGTFALPHFYDAHLLLHSRPPWLKELLYHWKLTFCVWVTFYIFLMLLMFILFFLRPLIFPTMMRTAKYQHRQEEEEEDDRDDQVSESLQRWHRSRSKRKAALLHESTTSCSSASSITFNRGEGCPSLDEGSGDSEYVCCAVEGG